MDNHSPFHRSTMIIGVILQTVHLNIMVLKIILSLACQAIFSSRSISQWQTEVAQDDLGNASVIADICTTTATRNTLIFQTLT